MSLAILMASSSVLKRYNGAAGPDALLFRDDYVGYTSVDSGSSAGYRAPGRKSSLPALKPSPREWRHRWPNATISAAIAACSMSAEEQARS